MYLLLYIDNRAWLFKVIDYLKNSYYKKETNKLTDIVYFNKKKLG